MMSPNLLPADGILCLDSNYMQAPAADGLLASLLHKSPWRHQPIYIFGRWVHQPRLMAWYSDPQVTYKYSGITLGPAAWPSEIIAIKERIERDFQLQFNSVLLNLYRDGKDYMGFHSDDEKELGPDPVIASLSLGAVRTFQLRHKLDKEKKLDLELEHGSLLVMAGKSQSYWQHGLPKRKRVHEPRINLTFRMVAV